MHSCMFLHCMHKQVNACVLDYMHVENVHVRAHVCMCVILSSNVLFL